MRWRGLRAHLHRRHRVLAVDATGKLKEEEKAGARSAGKGAGIGAALFLLGPAAIGIGVLGGAAGGALLTKGWD